MLLGYFLTSGRLPLLQITVGGTGMYLLARRPPYITNAASFFL